MPAHDPGHPGTPPMSPDASAELERLIGELPARKPSMMLDARISAACAAHSARSDPAPPRTARSCVLRYAAVAAMVLIAGTITIVLVVVNRAHPDIGDLGVAQHNDTPSPNSAAPIVDAGYRFDPNPINLEWTRDLGEQTRTTPSGKPYRAIVREAVQTQTWFDAQNGVTVQVTRPREELIIAHQPVF